MSQPVKPAMTVRRSFLLTLLAVSAVPLKTFATAVDLTMTVWKDPNCGCCADWVSHLEKNRFAVNVVDTGNQAMRLQLGMPPKFGSCHTAMFERLLKRVAIQGKRMLAYQTRTAHFLNDSSIRLTQKNLNAAFV